MPSLGSRAFAEFFGTFWLVLGGTGSAVLAAVFLTPDKVPVGIGFVGVSLAFGLTVLTMAYALGHISGGHFNPAVTIGLWAGKRFPAREILPYIIAQVVGAIVASAILYGIASGKPDYSIQTNGLAANGYGDHSPGGYSLGAGLITEIVLTFGFLVVILGSTDSRAQRFRADRDRTRANAHPSRQHSRYEHVGEPGALDGPRDLRRRLGARATLALLGRADRRCRGGRLRVSYAGTRARARARRRNALATSQNVVRNVSRTFAGGVRTCCVPRTE
jgi:MIP family channel proteins